jgi:hypothetical protein
MSAGGNIVDTALPSYGMATLIKFVDDETGFKVSESPAEVRDAFVAAAGIPFVVHRARDGAEVHVIPSAVAYFVAATENDARERLSALSGRSS